MPGLASASGFGVFTQGACGSRPGQRGGRPPHRTVLALLQPTLMNDVPGRQIEVGTTAVYADRSVDYDGGGSEDAKENWNFPSTFYYTHEVNPQVTAGLGVSSPSACPPSGTTTMRVATSAPRRNCSPPTSTRRSPSGSTTSSHWLSAWMCSTLTPTIENNINQDAQLTGGWDCTTILSRSLKGWLGGGLQSRRALQRLMRWSQSVQPTAAISM